MTPRVVVLPAADRDIDEQAEYLGDQASLEIALRFYDAAAETFAFIATQPGIGAPYEGRTLAGAGIRVWRISGFENHLAFYRPIEGGIEVVRVLHGAQDISRILELDDESDDE
jgi:toxin ParE1/3/4